jgi:hypothetical protein
VRQQAQGLAFECAAEPSEGLGEVDGRLPDAAAVSAPEPRHGEPQLDGIAAHGYRADGPFFGPVADDVGALAI